MAADVISLGASKQELRRRGAVEELPMLALAPRPARRDRGQMVERNGQPTSGENRVAAPYPDTDAAGDGSGGGGGGGRQVADSSREMSALQKLRAELTAVKANNV
jgi:hypothetical protein